MQEQKTLNLLNFSTNEFNTHCQELLKEMVEKNIKNCFKDIEEKLISERNNNISKAICGKDLYDYSELEDIYYTVTNMYEKGKISGDELVNVSTDEGYYKLLKMIDKKWLNHGCSEYKKDKYVKNNCVYTLSNDHSYKKIEESFSEKHYKLEKGEKIVFLFVGKTPYNKKTTPPQYDILVIITNFSRIFFTL